MHKYLDGNYLKDKSFENIAIQKENDLILGLRLAKGIDITLFNKKYQDDLLNRCVIKELIEDGYLVNDNHYLKCHEKYFYVENIILEKILGSEL